MYCGTCGKELRDGAKFCDECGAVQPELVIPESQQAKPEASPAEPIQPVLKVPAKPEKPPKAKKPKKKVPKGLIIGICAVLIVAIVAAVVLPRIFHGKETIYVLTDETHYNSDGVAFRHITYEYDENGLLLSREVDDGKWEEVWDEELFVYRYEARKYDGSVDTYEKYEYDEFGNVLTKETEEYDNYSIAYTFNDAGLIESYVYQANLSTDTSLQIAPVDYICEYDDNGNLLSVSVSTADGDRLAQAYEYDEEGRLEAEFFYDKEWTRRNEYSYGEDSLEVETYRAMTLLYGQDPEELEFELYGSVEYEFDEEGRLLEETHRDENGEKSVCYEYSYDENGFPEEMTSNFGDGVKFKDIEYTCDEFGNIVELENDDGSRIEYEYMALEVTAEQAAHYRRWEGCRRYDTGNMFYDYLSEHLYHQIPNPVWEIKMPII